MSSSWGECLLLSSNISMGSELVKVCLVLLSWLIIEWTGQSAAGT